MKLVETNVTETTIAIRFANDSDIAKATEWIDLCVPLARLVLPSGTILGDPEVHTLGEVRLAALRHGRDAIDDEIARLAKLIDRNRR